MNSKNKTRQLIDKIEEITLKKMRQESVVSLEDYRRTKKPTTPSTILVIEDEEVVRKALKRLLEDAGYHVIAFSDATQLNTVFDDRVIDLILLDIGLPWVNGFELAELMKSNQYLKSIPLIFISGRNEMLDIKAGFRKGADDYITKPFDNGQVLAAVDTLIQLTTKR